MIFACKTDSIKDGDADEATSSWARLVPTNRHKKRKHFLNIKTPVFDRELSQDISLGYFLYLISLNKRISLLSCFLQFLF